jgi:hypothetical protein
MKHYSIVQVGNEYVVRSGAKNILRVASRRAAVRLVMAASELMESSEVSVSALESGLRAQSSVSEPKFLDDLARFP